MNYRKFLSGFLMLFFFSEIKAQTWWEDSGKKYDFNLKGKKILVVAGYDFDWHETVLIPENLKKWGAEIKYCSSKDKLEGHYKNKINNRMDMSERRTISIDILLEDANTDFDALYLPGGYGPENLMKDSSAKELIIALIRKFNSEKKIVAAICHGPLLLAAADIVSGKNLTGFRQIQDQLINAGAIFQKEKYIIDGNLLTGNWPYFETFSLRFAELLIGLSKI